MTTPPSRRIPKQDRSRKRYDQILDVASKLFSEKGFERTSTNEIAALANISIGSLYQYFRNKEAIVVALLDRYVEAASGFTKDFVAREVQDHSVAEAIDELLDPYIKFHSENAAFSRLWLGADLSDQLDDTIGGLTDEALSRIETLVRARMPGIRKDRVRIIALVTQSMVKSLLSLLMRSANPRLRAQAATEVKRMLVDYFESLIREHRSA